MPEAFDISTQTSDEMTLDRGRGAVKLQVSNRLGRSVRACFSVEPDGDQGAQTDWLSIARTEHAFAPGGSTVVTVQVSVPAGTPAGRYPFRLVVAAEGDDERSRSAPVGLRHDTRSRPLWAALVIIAAVLAASGYGLYGWLAPPPCAVERAVHDGEQCACPVGMVESQMAGKSICLCASGTDYDHGSGTCVARSCEVEGARYAEAAGACTCPPGTQQAKVGDGARCVCPLGQEYDDTALACAPRPCATPEHALYDQRTGQCECAGGTERQTSAETGDPICVCPAGGRFDDAAQRCVTLPNLRVLRINTFPPLRMQRQFSLEVIVENAGGSPAGPFRLHVTATDAGVSFSDVLEVPALGPGQSIPYKSPQQRIQIDRPLRIQARIEPLGFEDSNLDDNVLDQSFPITIWGQ